MGATYSKEHAETWAQKVAGIGVDNQRVSLAYVCRNAKYGDMFLTMGDGAASCFIATNSAFANFSHVMMCVPGRDERGRIVKCISDAYGECAGEPVFKQHGVAPVGVQVVRIEERLRNYVSGKIIWRPMEGKPIPNELLQRFMRRMEQYTPETLPGYMSVVWIPDWIEFATKTDNDANIRWDFKFCRMRQYYVCTSWVAHLMMNEFGLLTKDRRPGNYNLGDFTNPHLQIPNCRARYGTMKIIDTVSEPGFFDKKPTPQQMLTYK